MSQTIRKLRRLALSTAGMTAGILLTDATVTAWRWRRAARRG